MPAIISMIWVVKQINNYFVKSVKIDAKYLRFCVNLWKYVGLVGLKGESIETSTVFKPFCWWSKGPRGSPRNANSPPSRSGGGHKGEGKPSVYVLRGWEGLLKALWGGHHRRPLLFDRGQSYIMAKEKIGGENEAKMGKDFPKCRRRFSRAT